MADFAPDVYMLALVVEQNLVGISAVMLVVFHRRLGINVTRHNVLQCRQRTKSRLNKKLKFSCFVLEMCERTNKQTYEQTYRCSHHNTSRVTIT